MTSPRPLATKLDYLFRTVHPRNRGSYSYREVSEAINEASEKIGVTISDNYLWMLRTGKRTNPTLDHLQAIARFFGVPTSYFTDDDKAEVVEAQLALVAAVQDQKIRRLALRAHGLSDDNLTMLTTLADQLRSVQGLTQLQSVDDQPGE